MPNPRHETQQSPKQMDDAAKKLTEQNERMTNTAVEGIAQTTRSGADIAKSSVENWQAALQSGLESTSKFAEQASQQFARTLGLSGEEAQKATQQSARNIEAIAQTAGVLLQNVQDMSREHLELWRKMADRNIRIFEAIARARTPQEVLAAQSEIVRENVQEVLQTTRKTAESSMRIADEAAKKLTEMSDKARRAA